MPYASSRQARFIHAKAAEGVPWAKKFVADAHGTTVKRPSLVHRLKKKPRKDG